MLSSTGVVLKGNEELKKIIDGFNRFKRDVFPEKRVLFRQLASGQNPHSLFITCADSRIVPHLITQSDPGDLFTSRNIGNLVPPYGDPSDGVSSAIEYAVQALSVQNIIVCGHTDCGAMKAVLHPEKVQGLPMSSGWLRHSDSARRVIFDNYSQVSDDVKLHLLIEENIVRQLEHLKTHPAVAARIARGDLELFGWLYHIHSAEITSFDAKLGRFTPLDEQMVSATPPPRVTHLMATATAEPVEQV